jgi:type I restriction enzyme S subunit
VAVSHQKVCFSDDKLVGYVQLIQIRDLGPNPQPVYVPIKTVSKFCTSEDIMVGRYGASVGKVFWGKNGAYNVALIKMINDYNGFNNNFLHLLLESPLGQSLFLGISRSAQSGFNKNDIKNRVIPLPPFAEQHRIVAKVNELMALCDQLEHRQADSNENHRILVETLLSTLTQAADHAGYTKAWQRIANNFDTLFATESSIDLLKKTILQLAVMGKLVPQDLEDEPASILLEKIAKEKVRLIEKGKIKKQKPLPAIAADERQFELPHIWEWTRLGSISQINPRNEAEDHITASFIPMPLITKLT